ncbi:MAG TPA: serine hydrolase, partial [Candidatus Limnocylindrales bacterium]|nr:serine hydrolase [Candidatus Limnocylindrales bacterium]
MATPLFRALSVLLVALVVACASPVPTPTPERTDFPTLPTSTFYDGPTPTSAAATETPSFTNPPTGTTSPTAEPTPAETTSTPTLPPDGSMAQILGTELGNTVEAERVRLEVPGTSAVILFPDGSRWTGVFGLADVERDLPVQSDTTFAVGSVTKTFTTAAIFQLHDEGALSIDDPLANWLPDYPNASAITLRHLLGHTSGVFNYFEDPQYNRRVFVTDVGHRWTPDEILTAFAREPYGVPGEQFHYSNTGFVLLGLVVEQET